MNHIQDPKHADTALTADQLADKYSPNGDGEHPQHPRQDWCAEVAMGNTLRGYWDWVVAQIEESEAA